MTARDEVLREAAEEIVASCPDHGPRDKTWMDCHCDAADELRRMADTAGKDTRSGESTQPADFFQPDHTYTEPTGVTDWRFRVDHITTHPDNGEHTALGWRHFRGEWEPYAYHEDDWDIHQLSDQIGEAGR